MHYMRKSGHDYHEGYYFITINTAPRRDCLSRIVDGKVELSAIGEIVLRSYVQMAADSPEIDLRVCAIMPDHFHAVIVFRRRSEHPLGWHVRRFKARATKWARDLTGDQMLVLFEENFHDLISFSADQLDHYTQYVKSNPIRWQWKHNHPDFFRKHFALRHPRLPAGQSWTAIGDRSLLDAPWVEPVIVHRRITETERKVEVTRFLTLAQNGATLIGGFISPGEREVAKRTLDLPNARVICLLPYGLKDYKPHGVAVKRLAESKTLVLSGFPETVPSMPINYDNCHLNNDWVQAIAAARCLFYPHEREKNDIIQRHNERIEEQYGYFQESGKRGRAFQ